MGNLGMWVRRPILWLLFVYTCGIVFSGFFQINVILLFLIMTILFISTIIIERRRAFLLLLVIMLVFGIIRGNLALEKSNPLDAFQAEETVIHAKVVGVPQLSEDRDIYILKVHTISIAEKIYETKGSVRLTVYPKRGYTVREAYRPGDIIQVAGILKEPSGQRNPKGFNYRAYLLRRGIQNIVAVSQDDIVLLEEGNFFSLSRTLDYMRTRSNFVLDSAVAGREANLLKGMLLGARWLVPPEVKNSFTQIGLSHILAISGLHVGFLVILLIKLTALLRLKEVKAFVLQVSLLIIYCLMVGAVASVVRAVIMGVLYLGGKAFGKRTDVLNSAGVAALAMLLIRPLDLYEIGFQLSFVTVCIITLMYHPVYKKLAFLPPKLASIVAVTIAAQLGSLPLTVFYFNSFSPYAVLANLILVPLAGIIVMSGFILLVIGMILPPLAILIGLPVKWLCTILIESSSLILNLPFSFIRIISPTLSLLFSYYIIIWFFSKERPRFVKRPARWMCTIVSIILLLNLTILLIEPPSLKVVFLDVGQGDCIYIRTPEKRHILIDSGGKMDNREFSFQIGENIILPFLLKHGVNRLDLAVMSHGHDDHIGGFPPVIEQLRVKTFMGAPPEKETSLYKEMMVVINRRSTEIIKPYRGQTYSVDKDVKIHILYPVKDDRLFYALSQGNENNRSLVILLEYQGATVLLTGDIEGRVEQYLSTRIGKVDILKVAHHGSKTSSSEAFISAVDPIVGIIQVGHNFYGHPNPQVLERFEDNGTEIFRNDQNGAVVCVFKQRKWTVKPMIEAN